MTDSMRLGQAANDFSFPSDVTIFKGSFSQHKPNFGPKEHSLTGKQNVVLDRTIMSPFINQQPFYPQALLEKLPRIASPLNRNSCALRQPHPTRDYCACANFLNLPFL
jgi:hypothetical protein